MYKIFINYRLLFSLTLLSLLIWLLLKAVDTTELFRLLSQFPSHLLLALALLSFLISLLKAWRFQIILKNSQVNLSFLKTVKVYLAGQATTPLPGGEALRGILVKKETGVSLPKLSGPVLLQAFFEFFSATILTIAGSIYLEKLRVPAIFAAILIAVMFFILTNKTWLKLLSARFSKLKLLQTTQREIEKTIKSKSFFGVLLIALIAHLLGGLIILAISNFYQGSLNPVESIFAYTASVVVSSASGFIPGGLGVTEGGMTGILLLFSLKQTQALAIVLIFRLISLIFYCLTGIVCLLIFYPEVIFKKNYD